MQSEFSGHHGEQRRGDGAWGVLTGVQILRRGLPIVESEHNSTGVKCGVLDFIRVQSRTPQDQLLGADDPDVARFWDFDRGRDGDGCFVFVRVNGCRGRRQNGEGEGGEDRGGRTASAELGQRGSRVESRGVKEMRWEGIGMKKARLGLRCEPFMGMVTT